MNPNPANSPAKPAANGSSHSDTRNGSITAPFSRSAKEKSLPAAVQRPQIMPSTTGRSPPNTSRSALVKTKNAADRVRAPCRPGSGGAWPAAAGNVRFSGVHALLREEPEGRVPAAAHHDQEADGSQATLGQDRAFGPPSSPDPRTGSMASQRDTRTCRLLRRAIQHRRRDGVPHPGDQALVQGATAPQPTPPAQLGTNEPPLGSVAPTRPNHASLA